MALVYNLIKSQLPLILVIFTQGIYAAIQKAFQESALRALGLGTGSPLWNDDCRAAVQAYRVSRRNSENLPFTREEK